MGCCGNSENDEDKPLLGDKKDEKDGKAKPTKTSKLDFKRLEVREFDKVFDDYARTLDPFVTDREKLEQAVTKFKKAVETIQDVRPQATFREYVKTLKTTLKNEGVFIKIKNGAVEVYGVGSRSVTAVQNAVDAIKTIMSSSEALKDMPEIVTSASGSALQDAESTTENIEHIIRREFSGVFDFCKIVRFRKNLKNNLEKMKSSPKMVKDFCEQVKMIVEDISKAFDEDRTDEDEDDEKESDKKDEAVGKKQEKNGKVKDGEKGEVDEEESKGDKKKEKKSKGKEKSEKEKKNEKEKEGKDKKNEEKKMDYQKQLKVDTIGLADIDKIFSDVMTTLNRFVATREKLQQAKDSFEKIMKTLCNFDGEKEFNEYIKELKKKALEGNIHIYIDTTNDDIRLDSVKGVDPPAPYRNAVKALNDVKSAAKKTMDLEPEVQNGLEACSKDIVNIEPLKDFKKMVSGAKEVMTLPKKAKAFNENRKKVQKAPQIIKEFCQCVKQILVDIAKAFTEEEDTEKKDETSEKKQNDEEKENESGKENEDGKENESGKENGDGKDEEMQEVAAIVHVPQKSDKNEEENENKNIAV